MGMLTSAKNALEDNKIDAAAFEKVLNEALKDRYNLPEDDARIVKNLGYLTEEEYANIQNKFVSSLEAYTAELARKENEEYQERIATADIVMK